MDWLPVIVVGDAALQHAVVDILPFNPITFIPRVVIDPKDEERLPISPLTRWYLQRPQRRICDRMMLPNIEAVGRSLEHAHAWRWMTHHPEYTFALITEHSDCLRDMLSQRSDLIALLRDPGVLDVLVLRYRPVTPTPVTVVGGVPVCRRPWFDAVVCYIVSHRGARKLLAHAFPVEMSVDHYMACAIKFRLVSGYGIRTPLGGDKWRSTDRTAVRLRQRIPEISLAGLVGCLLSLLAVLMVVTQSRKT